MSLRPRPQAKISGVCPRTVRMSTSAFAASRASAPATLSGPSQSCATKCSAALPPLFPSFTSERRRAGLILRAKRRQNDRLDAASLEVWGVNVGSCTHNTRWHRSHDVLATVPRPRDHGGEVPRRQRGQEGMQLRRGGAPRPRAHLPQLPRGLHPGAPARDPWGHVARGTRSIPRNTAPEHQSTPLRAELPSCRAAFFARRLGKECACGFARHARKHEEFTDTGLRNLKHKSYRHKTQLRLRRT